MNKIKKILGMIFFLSFIICPIKASAASNLKELSIDNATLSPIFSEDQFSYDIIIESDTLATNINYKLADTKAIITNAGPVTLKSNQEHTIAVIDEAGNISVYKLYPKKVTNALKNLEFANIDFEFKENVLEYTLSVPFWVNSLDVTNIDSGYTYSFSDNFIRVGNNDIKMTVSKTGIQSIEYLFHITRKDSPGTIYEYTATGSGYETFVAPKDGKYKIELWGAQGGNYNSLYGGKGSYTSGEIELKANDTLYIYIGTTTTTRTGGYNGGASGGTVTTDGNARGGGGATDVRLVSGSWDDFNSLKSRIMVAAGGGGAILYQNIYPQGGAGGGLTGYGASLSGKIHTLATGATQTSGGYRGGESSCSLGASGTFGAGGAGGASGVNAVGTRYGGGGGGGYYGGGGGGCIGSGVSSGSSGSSYVSGHTGSNSISINSTSTSITHTGSATHYSNMTFTNTKIIDGLGKTWTTVAGEVTNMPSWDGTTTMTGNSGNGHAKITLMEDIEPKLTSLTITGGELEETFNPNVFEYTMYLNDEQIEIDVLGLNDNHDVKIEGNGTYIIDPGKSTIEIKVTNPNNESNTYVINIERDYSSAPILNGILVNGYEIPDFDPEVLEYTVEVEDIFPVAVVDGILAYPGQEVTGGGVKILEDVNKLDVVLMVVSEDRELDYKYIVHIIKKETTKLKSLLLDDNESLLSFQPNILDYELKLLPNVMNLNVEAIPAASGAKVEIVGNTYIAPTKDSSITITVSKEGLESTVYEIKIIRSNDLSEYHYEYPYDSSKDYYEFVAPVSGFYNIEAWGAQGGSFDGLYGGEGAYTKGEIKLTQGEKLYIYIGSTTETRNAGYNSGANGGTMTTDGTERGGGGATDIRLTAGAWNDFNSLKSRIMVAAGGGGAILYQNTYVKGGAGGGLIGYGGALKGVNHTLATGATQTTGGSPGGITTCSQGAKGGFGPGGSGGVIRTTGSSLTYGGGGGGGYFGGGGGGCIGGGVSSGSSGSSFISGHYGSNAIDEISTSNNITFSSQEIHYSGKQFINTLMIDGNGYDWSNVRGSLTMMPNKDGGYNSSGAGNTGDGYAKIRLISLLSSDNYLDELVVSTGTLEPSFETGTFDYNLELGEEDSKLEIGAIAKDPNATVTGTGLYDIKPGYIDYTISVTATDGSIRNYVIHVHRKGSSDATPTTIKLNKLSSYLCKKNSEYCIYTFDPEVLNYEVTIPFVTDVIELKATAKSIYQTIEYYKYEDGEYVLTETGLYDLESGENKFKVVVTAEDGETTNEYLYSIIRDDAGNANLKSLVIENPDIEIDFEKDVYEYYLNIDSAYTSYDVIAETESPDANITSITGNTNLRVGLNDCYILITSQNGTTKTYVIHMYKEQDTNVFLKTLDIKDQDGNSLEINPTFNKLLNNYSLTVANAVNEITINAEAESLDATVAGTGKTSLSTGVNTITVLVESGENRNEYEIVINRAKNSNAILEDIIIEDFDLIPDFTSDNTEYYLIIDKDTTKLNVTAIPEEETTTYTVTGNVITMDQQDIVITSIAEDRTYKIYTIHVSRDIDEDNTLERIELPDGITLNEEFSPSKNNYTVPVPDTISKLDIKGIANSSKATVNGNGIYSLVTGENTIKLDVTSEMGETNTYTITVTKQKSNDSSLKLITNNRGSDVRKESETSYLIDVQYEVTSIEINAYANSPKATVTGNGNYSLNSGEDNIINIRVTAEDNTYTDYKIKVVRDKSQNDDLSFLYIKEGGLQPNFKETTIVYDVYVPNSITDLSELHIEAIPEDKNASYEVIGNSGALEVGVSKEIVVRVIAEDGKNTKNYTVNITRQEATTENLALLKLETNRGSVSPTFSADILNYTLEVENEISDITVTGTSMTDNVIVEGNGTYNLKVGKNLISIFVIGTDGVQRDYQIVVTRKKSSDASLANLVVKGNVLSPTFNKNTLNYNLTISGNTLEFTTIKPTENESEYKIGIIENNTFEVLPQISFNTIDITDFPTTKELIIRVTAPDGFSTKDYSLTITKEPSKNNNLSFLEVEGYNLTPEFHKGINTYTLEVPNEVKNIIINATPEDTSATVTGTGVKVVDVGSNIFEITVESAAGTTKKYTIIVSKNGSNNNNIASLNVSAGTLSPDFNSNIQEYTVNVPFEVSTINISGILEDAKATTNGFKEYSLAVGHNEINIYVTSEAGDIKIYRIIVNRSDSISAELKSLEVKGYELDNEFNPYITEYYLDVNNEIDSLDKLNITAIPMDSEATFNITSTKDTFDIGINEVKILVTAKDGITTKEYILYVNRNLSTNNYLQTINTSEGELNPEFDPKIMEYEIHVSNDITTINIDAKTEDSSSTIVSGIGDVNLVVGTNKIQIKVKSSIGIYRTYFLNIIREGSSDNYLSSLFVKKDLTTLDFNEPFRKENNNYTMTVPSDTLVVTIGATPSNNLATVSGTGIKSLVKGENTFEINVTSESGEVNIYTITITKEISSNNAVINIIPSSGEFTEEFNPAITEYTLNVDSDISSVSFEVIVEDSTSVVTGNDLEVITGDTPTRYIIITAEDGTQNTYTIHINKASEAEARLDSLSIEGYPFEFNPDTNSYIIQVSNSKKELLESEITAIPKDSDATINMMGDLDLIDGIVNIYIIEVIAKDGYTTENYELMITRDSEEYTLRSNMYEIVRYNDDNEEDYVIGIQPSTIISDFKNNFENEPEMLHVYLENEVDEEDLTATAFILKLEKDGYVYDTLRVIVRGDLTNDGKVNITDQVKLINYVGRTTALDKYQMLAADLTFDGNVNITDQVKIINYVGRTISDLNNKPTN